LSAAWIIEEGIFFAGLLLIVLAFPGGYLRQVKQAGRLGFVGFVLLWLGVLLAFCFSGVRITLWPYLAQFNPKLLPSGGQGSIAGFLLWILLPGLLLILGDLLMGSAILRARVFPRWVGILFLAAGVISILTFILPPSGIGEILDPLSDAFFFLALAWTGYLLFAPSTEQVVAQSVTSSTIQTE
jgi:hypothetical protein